MRPGSRRSWIISIARGQGSKNSLFYHFPQWRASFRSRYKKNRRVVECACVPPCAWSRPGCLLTPPSPPAHLSLALPPLALSQLPLTRVPSELWSLWRLHAYFTFAAYCPRGWEWWKFFPAPSLSRPNPSGIRSAIHNFQSLVSPGGLGRRWGLADPGSAVLLPPWPWLFRLIESGDLNSRPSCVTHLL